MNAALKFLIASKRCEIAGLRQLADTSDLVRALAHLVHALQRERGLSNLYLGSQGTRGDGERQAQVEHCLELQTRVQACFDALAGDTATSNSQGMRLFACIAYVLQGLDALPSLRQQVQAQVWPPAQAAAGFSQLIQALLSVVFEAADSALDPTISRHLVALFNFMQGKEFAGQERATGSALLAAGHADTEGQHRLLRLIESQEQCLHLFMDFANPDQIATWQQSQQNGAEAQLERLRRVMCTATPTTALDTQWSQTWFDVCTTRINTMKAMEDVLVADLQTLCTHQQAAAQEALHALQALSSVHEDGASATFFDHAPFAPEPPGRLSAHEGSGYGTRVNRSILETVHAQALRLQAMSDELDTVRASLHERKLVERAKGLLMAHHQLSEDDAHKALRHMAMNQNRRLIEVAEAVLTTAEVLPRTRQR